MTFEEYIQPEMLVLVPVLFIIGMGLKKMSAVYDNYIPLILGATGAVLALMYQFSVMGFSFEAVFTGLIQGILCAGAAVYGHQAYKQLTKEK